MRSDFLTEHADEQGVPAYCGLRSSAAAFVRYATGEEELYDPSSDPYQLRNVASAYPSVVAAMRSRLAELCHPPPARSGQRDGPSP